MDTKKLRQKILDLAIHGKLVPQDPNDEPASVLLERIRAEKEQLIKEGKIKAPKKSKTAGDTSHYGKEWPFQAPSGWEWRYLEDIGKWQSGSTPSRGVSAYYGGTIPWLKTGDLNDGLIITIPEHITERALVETSVKLNPAGSVLIAMYGATIGKVGILTFPATTNQACCACSEFNGVTNKYLFYFLISNKEAFIRQGGGGAQPNISKEIIVNTPIPIPPEKEQERIVNAIEEWLNLISQVEQAEYNLQISIDACKAKVLNLAIHGKLVPQDSRDEPAIELLKRINPAFKPSDNLHYEGSIPSGWQIVRIGDVIDLVSGTSYQKTDIVSAGTGIRVLRGGNIQDGNILICEDDVFIDSSLANKCNTIGRGDTVIVASTGSSELIGKAAFATKDYPETQIGAFLRIIRPKSICISEYLGLIFQTEYYKHHIKQVAKGTNINNIKSSYITEFVIPLPPLEEQRRIQCQLKRLLSTIDQITDFINGSE